MLMNAGWFAVGRKGGWRIRVPAVSAAQYLARASPGFGYARGGPVAAPRALSQPGSNLWSGIDDIPEKS
jgi:hypothetical protein